jgi:hypothetical protein
MGADKPPDSGPGISQIAAWTLGAIVFLAALAALYEVGKGIHHPLLLPAAAVVLALFYALVRYSPRWAGPILAARRERARRLGNYALLVEEVRLLKEDKQRLEQREKALEQGATRRYVEGLREGRAQFVGAYLAQGVKEMPTIVSVAMADGRVQLTCQPAGTDPIELNARFFLVVTGSHQPLGAVSVTKPSKDGQTFVVEAAEETDAPFWTHLKQRADHDFAAPPGVSMERYLIMPLPEEKNG